MSHTNPALLKIYLRPIDHIIANIKTYTYTTQIIHTAVGVIGSDTILSLLKLPGICPLKRRKDNGHQKTTINKCLLMAEYSIHCSSFTKTLIF